MRITQKMMANQVNSNLSRNVEKLLNTQSHISSGKRIMRASDDPVGISKSLGYHKMLDSMDQYVRNISNARSGLEAGESALADINEVLNRARELTVAQATGTASAESRNAAAQEVRQIRDQLIQLANTKQGDRYLFGGRNTVDQPYNLSTSSEFQGDGGEFSVMIADGVSMDVAVSGENAFSSVDPLDPLSTIKKDPVVVLTDLITDLESNNETAISGYLDSLDQVQTQITNERSNVGARLNRLDSTEAHWETYKLNISQMLSDTEDLDLTQAVTDLTAQQSAYQASLASASKIIQPSLLDYLR
jgi:flagellar hook-associated protein 3 FlgL